MGCRLDAYYKEAITGESKELRKALEAVVKNPLDVATGRATEETLVNVSIIGWPVGRWQLAARLFPSAWTNIMPLGRLL